MMSKSAKLTRTGGLPSSPVVAMRPLMAWTTRSYAGRCSYFEPGLKPLMLTYTRSRLHLKSVSGSTPSLSRTPGLKLSKTRCARPASLHTISLPRGSLRFTTMLFLPLLADMK